MRQIAFLVVAIVTVAGIVTFTAPPFEHADQEAAPAYVTAIPQGYRDWRWLSSAHEAANFNSLGAVLGNDVAIKAYREGTLPFPDGTMIAALHYVHAPNVENNK